MGEVYKALDLKLNRLVALKFLAPGMSLSTASRERFMQEAAALSLLNHPHIATLFDIEESDGAHFLVLEYLPGGTLKALLESCNGRGEHLPIEGVLDYATQAADGLSYAHRRGIIHRDLKTSNLMLTEEGQLKITDFGVAKLSRFSANTAPGSLIGTLRYMSPEQSEGREVDGRSDLFSLGVVLFELTTSRLPFEGETRQALLAKIASLPAPALSAFRADVPAEWERIVAKLLMKQPAARYQNADDLLEDLRSCDASVRERTRSGRSHRAEIHRPKIARVARLGAAAVFLVILTVSAVYFYAQRHRSADPAVVSRLEQTIAVLPFAYVGSSPSDEAFNAGLFEIVANRLSQAASDRLKVISANQVLEQKVRKAVEARTLLGAQLVLTGVLQPSATGFLLSTSLIDASKQITLQSREIHAAREELPTLPEKVVEQALQMLKLPPPKTSGTARSGLTHLPEALALYSRGRGYLQRYDREENLEKAIDAFDRALSLDSGFALAHAGRAESYLRRYQVSKDIQFLKEARASCQRAIDVNRELFDVHLIMGLIHRTAGEYPDAIISFESALKAQPESPDALRELANTYVAAGRLDEAEGSFKRLIRLRPDDWTAYKDLGLFYGNLGRITEAIGNFKRFADLTPDSYMAYRSLGGLYIKAKNYRNAEDALQRSLKLQPTDVAYSNLGSLYYLQGRYREAAESCLKAVELNASNGIYWGNFGDAYRWIPGKEKDSQQAYQRAIALFDKELSVNPLDVQARANTAMYWSLLGNHQRALAELNSALKFKPDDGLVLSRAVIVYEQAGMRDQALAAVAGAARGGFQTEIASWPTLKSLREDPRYAGLIAGH